MKQIVLTNTNYLNHTREDLIKIGFTHEQINGVVYGELKEARLKSSPIGQDNKQINSNGGVDGN